MASNTEKRCWHGQESYLRVLNVALLEKNVAYWKTKEKSYLNLFFKKKIMNCGDIEENQGALDQCYTNNNFIANDVLGVRNSSLLLETRVCKLNRIAVDNGVVIFFFSCCVTSVVWKS